MATRLSRLLSRKGQSPLAETDGQDHAPASPQRGQRIGLWVLSTFALVAALVAISAAIIGPGNADAMVLIPLALFWAVAISVGFAIRAALMNVVQAVSRRFARSGEKTTTPMTPAPAKPGFLSRRKEDKDAATQARLARMVRSERNREALHAQTSTLIHAG